MFRKIALAGAAVTLGACAAFADDKSELKAAPPGEPYQQVSELVPLPEFIPGLGTLYVDPATLPAGPFLGYDREGRLSATIYMTPLEELEAGTAYDGLNVGLHEVSSVDIYYNAGHPGVEKPHAHVVLFHDEDAKSRLAEWRHGGGTARGEHVWFAPYGLAVAPGTTLRFVNLDQANSHTATAYHPANFDRPLRIPRDAGPWDSGYLLPEESFEVRLSVPGAYDYYCQPHELGGMVGRIAVGRPDSPGWQPPPEEAGDLPEEALAAFPTVRAILSDGPLYARGTS